MVDITFTDLIAVSYNSSVLIAEGTFHEVIIEMTDKSFDMFIKSEFFVNIAVFIVSPAESSSCIVFRHTEFNVVAGIVEAAGNVDSTVAVGIKHILVLLHEFSRKVSTALAGFCSFLVPFDHRNVCIVGVAAAAP